jgi:hypothetical protein
MCRNQAKGFRLLLSSGIAAAKLPFKKWQELKLKWIFLVVSVDFLFYILCKSDKNGYRNSYKEYTHCLENNRMEN